MSVGDSITCECNNCVDEEIKTVSARHAEAFEALEHLFVLSSKARCKADRASKIRAIPLKLCCCSRRIAVASRPDFTSRRVAI